MQAVGDFLLTYDSILETEDIAVEAVAMIAIVVRSGVPVVDPRKEPVITVTATVTGTEIGVADTD
eukprot:gene7818-10012_t